MKNIAKSINYLQQQIVKIAIAAGRDPTTIALIGVSKNFSSDAVRVAATAGLTDIGENYVQESLAKIQQLQDLSLTWHFIGHLQRNKARYVAQEFNWVHTVDSLPLAQKLSAARDGLPPLNICLQVNIDMDNNKYGIMPQNILALVKKIASLPHLCLRGLMTIPRQGDHGGAPYRALAALRDDTAARCGFKLDVLSMGMSGDFKEAIIAGATHVRLGTAIFGDR